MSKAGVVAIELEHRNEPHCSARGDCEIDRGHFVFADARGTRHTGAVIDVHLAAQRLAISSR